jgi:hypothetical protein
MENAVFDSDKFISIVQMHPALWDSSDGDYAYKIKKAQNSKRSVEFTLEVANPTSDLL